MVKVTMTIEGSPVEVRHALAAVLAENEPTQEQARVATEEWTPDLVQRMWANLSSGAQRIVREVGKKPHGYGWSELRRVLGLSGNELGGSLSSIGHQKRIFGVKQLPEPLQIAHVGIEGGYKLEPVWQQFVESLN